MRPRLPAVAILTLVLVGGLIGARFREGAGTWVSCGLHGTVDRRPVLDAFPPPPDFPDPEGAILSFDSNDDGTVCVLPLPKGRVNLIDNVAR